VAQQLKSAEPDVTIGSRLIEYLPSVYHEANARDHLLDDFLLAFETILLGRDSEPGHGRQVNETGKESTDHGTRIEGLEQKIARLHVLFNPEETPENFLPWLASWVALDLRADLPRPRRRKLLANIVPLYQIRGTKKYMEKVLQLHLDGDVTVDDSELPRFQVGVHSTLGSDTYVDGGPPYFFRVKVELSASERELEVQAHMAREVIELAKPAHTVYLLEMIRR